MHIHTLTEEVELDKLIEVTDKKTKKVNKKPAFVKESQMAICNFRVSSELKEMVIHLYIVDKSIFLC